MWTFRKKIWYALYKVFASWLPMGQRSKFAKHIRYFFARHICQLGKNVNIADGCVIGAGAVVTKDIPPYSVAARVPTHIVRPRLTE